MFTALEKTALDQSLHSTRNQAAAAFWFEAGSLLVLGAVIFVSLRGLRVGAANILLLLAVFTRLMPRLASGSGQLQAFLSDLPAFEAIGRISQECRENAEVFTSSDPAVSGPAPVLAHELRLEDVSFRYEPQLPWVLDRMSLTIAAGKITAIAGASGAGKSTIADVVNGLLLPNSGHVLVDGVPITRQAGRAWRRQVGYVAQDTMLFHDTVRANMLWARPGASEDELREALTLAAAEFVFDLPRGLDTMAGDRGVLLSNGQRQRIALARALLRKPSLLILDEATNSLDMENEKRILDAIEQLKKRITIVLIAHRASAVRRAETIYVVENGRVVECGNWESLSNRPSTLAGSLFSMPGVPVA
jgi:ATP-binding cassette subfamily C protein